MKSGTIRMFKEMPSFVGGMTAALSFDENISDNFNTEPTDAQADFNSLASDWKTVGDDMRASLSQYGPEA